MGWRDDARLARVRGADAAFHKGPLASIGRHHARLTAPFPAVLRFLLAACLALAALSATAAERPLAVLAPGLELDADARAVLAPLLKASQVPAEADDEDEERALRLLLADAREALATEGWFEPTLKLEPGARDGDPYLLRLETGPRVLIGEVDLRFEGAVTDPRFEQRLAALKRDWPLVEGMPFRAPAWEAVKTWVVEDLSANDFATARIAASRVEVDVPKRRARVELTVDSGPAYTFGPLRVEGLTRYPASVVESLNPPSPGQPFDRTVLNDFAVRLQASSFLAGATVIPQFDPDHPDLTPVLVTVNEAQRRRLSVGVGYASDTGAHFEVLYRQAMVFDRPWTLQAGARIDQVGGYGFAELLLPLRGGVWRDAVGVLFDDSEIENQRVRRIGAGASTTRLLGPRLGRNHETTYTLNYSNEKRTIPDAAPIQINTLSATVNWIFRDVDSVTNPRSGQLLQLQGSLGASGASMGDGFQRAYGRIVQFLPLGSKDVLVLRAELGYVNAESTSNVPNSFLFRTGGATSVRGYDFQSLGVDENGAVVGGRALAVGSLEYVHWVSDWGVAAFVDAGDAAARVRDLSPAWGYGLGARVRTPAGPFAIDVAYGERYNQVRVQFAVTLAF